MPIAEIRGLRIHYDLLGPADKEPVIFLNGVLMTTRSWVLQTARFRKHYRCVLHDFRGQLLSDKPAEPWTLEDHAEDLRLLLDHLAIAKGHIVGTSYGGEVGMIFAASRPERVASLTVISSASEVDAELDAAVAGWREAALTAPETVYRVALPLNFSPQFIATSPEMIDQGEERLSACPPEFFQALAHLIDAFRALDITADLERIECPTLVMVGENDALKPPRYSRLIAERIAGCELLVIPGAGHAVIFEQPSAVNRAVLAFLDKHRGRAIAGEPPTPAS